LGRRHAIAVNSQALRAYGVTEADIPDLVEKAAQASSMKENPIVLTPQELRQQGRAATIHR
jgi:alcohol dehydrogenase class IV